MVGLLEHETNIEEIASSNSSRIINDARILRATEV